MKTGSFLLLIVTLASSTALAIVVEQKNLTPAPLRQSVETQQADESKLNETWNSLPPREKASVIRLHQALRQMPPEERKFINDRIGSFLRMSSEERRRLKENNERWKKMTPEERQQARDKFQQERKALEEKWRKEHPGEEPPPSLFRSKAEPKNNLTKQESTP